MKSKRTSLNDIAKALGVSKATVSFVLNDKGDQFNISKEKQRLIKEKAKELSYVPNFFAKSLRQGETKTIGIVLPDISNAFYSELCKTMQEELYAEGYNVFIINSNEDKELEKASMKELIQRSIDGMIIAPSNDIEELIPILRATHIPVVFTDRPGDENADFVGVDYQIESEKIIRAFSEKPKRVVSTHRITTDTSTINKKIEGLKKACEEHEIDFESITFDNNDDNGLYELVQQQIQKGTDAFVPLTAPSTWRTFSMVNRMELKFQEDVRIIAFEDNESFQFMCPPISALRQPVQDIGKRTVARLYERIKESKDPGTHFLLSCEMVQRHSH